MNTTQLVETVAKYATQSRKEDGEAQFTALLAYNLAYSLPIPGQRVSSPDTFYRETVLGSVKELLNALNEKLVIRLPEILDLTKELWKIRYHVVHPAPYGFGYGLVITKEQIAPIFLKELEPIIRHYVETQDDIVDECVKVVTRPMLLKAFIGYFGDV